PGACARSRPRPATGLGSATRGARRPRRPDRPRGRVRLAMKRQTAGPRVSWDPVDRDGSAAGDHSNGRRGTESAVPGRPPRRGTTVSLAIQLLDLGLDLDSAHRLAKAVLALVGTDDASDGLAHLVP